MSSFVDCDLMKTTSAHLNHEPFLLKISHTILILKIRVTRCRCHVVNSQAHSRHFSDRFFRPFFKLNFNRHTESKWFMQNRCVFFVVSIGECPNACSKPWRNCFYTWSMKFRNVSGCLSTQTYTHTHTHSMTCAFFSE